MELIKKMLNHWEKIVLILIVMLTGFLTFYAVGNEGYANEYYSAAVKSMIKSFHNFFYVDFDGGGYVTVDKPALGIWLQALSTMIFGFHGWSLILPEALSAIISVLLIYHLINRSFGKVPALIAAFILGISPILIAVARTNELDSSLVMTVLFATWVLIKATEKGSFKMLALSTFIIGLGFNIKMMEAYLVLPALYLVYLFSNSISLRKRLVHLVGATIVLAVVSLSWATIVDLTPKSERPYIGSSKTNSVIELAFGYNGIQRLTGRNNGHGNFNNMNNQKMFTEKKQIQQNNNSNNLKVNNNRGNFNRQGFGGGSGGETGNKGVLRIFNQQLGGQIAWFLPLAFFGIIILCFRARNKLDNNRKAYIQHLLLWTGWVVPMIIYFSIAGFFHRYYMSMLTPGIAALSGIAIYELTGALKKLSKTWILLPLALIVTSIIQGILIWRYTQWRNILLPVVLGISIVATLSIVLIKLFKKENLAKTVNITVLIGFIALSITPTIWSLTPILYGSNTTMPFAGPELNRQSANNFSRNSNSRKLSTRRNMAMNSQNFQRENTNVSSKEIDFLLKNKKKEKFILAVPDSHSAAPIILKTGESVMAMGGFSGSDNIMTLNRLKKMVNNGDVRYFQVGGRGREQQSAITNWITKNGKAIKFGVNNSIYDLGMLKDKKLT